MAGSIAWVRLIIYIGSSSVFLIEIYRLLLILLSLFVILDPFLNAVFQNLIIWGLLFGFGVLSIGFYKLYKSFPPLLDPNEYSIKLLFRLMILTTILSIGIAMIVVLPPITQVSENYQVYFSIFTSFLWFFYYLILFLWIPIFKTYSQKLISIRDSLVDIKSLIHLFVTFCVLSFWFFDLMAFTIFAESIFQVEYINISYIVFLIIFLYNQIFLFFNVRKLSFKIIG